MINKERAKKIANLSLPIMGGMVSQNILNVVDTAMVGVLGQNALAAVGIASFMNFLAMSFLMGLGSGVQAMVARRKGEGQESKMALPLNGGLLTALALSLPATFLLIYLVPYVFPFIMNDPAVIPLGVDYLQLRLIGLAAVAANFAFRGFWNGINMSTIYFRTLIVMHALNILISYVLIFGRLGFPAMGVGGAGLGTALSTWFGALYYVILAFKHARPYGFCKELPKWDNIKTLWRVGFPASVQMFFFAGGMTTLFWIISQIGTKEVAAANVLINVMLVAILPSIGFAIARSLHGIQKHHAHTIKTNERAKNHERVTCHRQHLFFVYKNRQDEIRKNHHGQSHKKQKHHTKLNSVPTPKFGILWMTTTK